jgi:hypothetical protein
MAIVGTFYDHLDYFIAIQNNLWPFGIVAFFPIWYVWTKKNLATLHPSSIFFVPLPLLIRVARWYILMPQVPIWVNFGGPLSGKCGYIVWLFCILLFKFCEFYGHLVHL